MWTTLLIGGHSGSGKSTLARQLALREDAQVWSLDALVAGETSESERLLERVETWDAAPAEVVRVLRRAGLEFAPALETLVHRAQNLGAEKTIIEGERIRPDVAAELIRQVGPTLGAFFLIEPDAEITRAGLETQSRAFRLLSESRQRSVLAVNRLYGRWVEQEAHSLNLPVVHPQPWTTLLLRARNAARRNTLPPSP